MTITTPTYPTAQTIYTEIKEFISKFDVVVSDWDEFIYDFISENYDMLFLDDAQWFNEEDTDMKDQLRDELLEMFGVA